MSEANAIKKGYKQTEVGEIPEDWEVVSVNSVTKFHKQGYYTTEQYKDDGKYYLLRGTDMQNPKIDLSTTPRINANTLDYDSYKVLVGDFLFVRSGAIGRYGIITKEIPDSIFGSYLINFRFTDQIDSSYFGYFYQSRIALNQISSITQGGGNLNINAENIKALKIPLPSTITEQTAIATALSDMDNLIAGLEQLIEKKKAIKQGAMQELLRPKEGWVVKKLGEVVDILDNLRVPLNDVQRSAMKGDIPYCGANGIVDYVNDYIIDDDIILMAEDGGYFDEYKTRPIAYRMIGKCWVNNHAHILKAKSGFDQSIIYYSLVHKDILDYINGGTRAKLNKGDLINIEIPIPLDKNEQSENAQILNELDDEIMSLEKNLEKYRLLKQGMMQELLTGKTRLV